MNDIAIESAGGFVIVTEQWGDELYLTVTSGPDPEDTYDGKSILLDVSRVRQIAEWLAVWLAKHGGEND